MIGQTVNEDKKEYVRELIFNYLDLSNEQIYYRTINRISSSTWKGWSGGIEAHLKKPAFQLVWDEIKNEGNCGFTFLERLEKDYGSDPVNWK